MKKHLILILISTFLFTSCSIFMPEVYYTTSSLEYKTKDSIPQRNVSIIYKKNLFSFRKTITVENVKAIPMTGWITLEDSNSVENKVEFGLWSKTKGVLDDDKYIIVIPSMGSTTPQLWHLAAEFVNNDFSVIFFPHRGEQEYNREKVEFDYGLSEVDELKFLIQSIRDQYPVRNKVKIGVYGVSLGGVLGAYVAKNENSIDALCTEGLVYDFPALAKRMFSDEKYEKIVGKYSNRYSDFQNISPKSFIDINPTVFNRNLLCRIFNIFMFKIFFNSFRISL